MTRSRMRRTVVAWILAAVGVVALAVLAGLPVYVFPPKEEPVRADVVQVLGPALDDRIEMARQLVADGYADHVLVSVPPAGEPASDPGFCDEALFTCAVPEPYTTDGETLLLEQYARAHDAWTAIVLTGTGHVSRARYIYATCYPGDATVIEVPWHPSVTELAWTYAYQTGAFIKAFVTPCAATPAD